MEAKTDTCNVLHFDLADLQPEDLLGRFTLEIDVR
jgi:hypothetical protein